MSRYEALAGVYDSLMADARYEKRSAYLHKLMQKSAIPVETVLDLGCGTGTIACALAELGYQVIATDGSEEMLTQAKLKEGELTQRPLFLH